MLGSITKLVGGTHDGTTLDIHPDNHLVRLPIYVPEKVRGDGSDKIRTESYKRMRFNCDGAVVSLFALDGMSSLDVMLALGHHYHPPQDVDPAEADGFRKAVYDKLMSHHDTYVGKRATRLYLGHKQKAKMKGLYKHMEALFGSRKAGPVARDEFIGLQIYYVDDVDHLEVG